MATTEFTVRSGGSNLYAGTLDGIAEASTTPLVTYTNGAWVSGTGIFTPITGNPVSAGVVAGQFASVYTDGASAPTGFVGRITSVSSVTITVSITAKAGTVPTTGATGLTLVVGGAWVGPSGAAVFPFNFIAGTLTNAAGDMPRVNFKNNQTYNMTAAIVHASAGPGYLQGYTTTFADGGMATIDGGSSGASYILFSMNTSTATYAVSHFVFQNNGATGVANGVEINNTNEGYFRRCVFSGMRGSGMRFASGGSAVECEAYNCNISNSAAHGGFRTESSGIFLRCLSHSNAGNANNGFVIIGTTSMMDCIATNNGLYGLQARDQNNQNLILNCDFYNNTSSGIGAFVSAQVFMFYIENCNFIKNGGYGIDLSGITSGIFGTMNNCGFGSGTQANSSGPTNGLGGILVANSITYASGVTPWVDPANGDFRINLPAAIGTGRGTFTEILGGYAGTVGYPDIGAAQAQPGGTTGATFAGG